MYEPAFLTSNILVNLASVRRQQKIPRLDLSEVIFLTTMGTSRHTSLNNRICIRLVFSCEDTIIARENLGGFVVTSEGRGAGEWRASGARRDTSPAAGYASASTGISVDLLRAERGGRATIAPPALYSA
ncbi:unnamed protein product [Colias eurytheme]|nr:unnamed protein product [Colias eurytheme]